MSNAWRRRAALAAGVLLGLGLGGALPCRGDGPVFGTLELRPAAQVLSDGVFLSQVIRSEAPMPALRLCDAPALGKTLMLKRSQVREMARAAIEARGDTNDINETWRGLLSSASEPKGTPDPAVKITRKARLLTESELQGLLTTHLQEEFVKDRGGLELHFSHPWTAANVPDEPMSLKVLEMPSMGITPSFIIRFELVTASGELAGSWQAALQAHIWREILVSRSALRRGEPAQETAIGRERRDIILLRESLAENVPADNSLEIAEPVTAGAPILARDLKLRPVVRKGQSVAALLEDGSLSITLKVEALEDGAPGQLIRVQTRNRDATCGARS